MNENFVVSVLFITLALGIISLGCQIYVSRQLKKAGVELGFMFGRTGWIKALILGWRHAKQLEIVDVMAFWSFLLVLTSIGMIVVMIAVLQVPS